jgi:hypothetical protein
MASTIAKRSPEAVKELEAMQQQERAGAGESSLTTEDFERLLRKDIERELVSAQLDLGGVDAAVQPVVPDKALVEEIYQARRNAWRVDDLSQWSRYETPASLWAIAGFCTRIESVFAYYNWALNEVPVVGTLTTGQVAARTQRSSSGAPMVLIENGFFKFSGMMSQAAVFASYDMRVKGGLTDPAVQLVADLAVTQTVLNTCLYAYPRTTPPDFRKSVDDLQDAICLFVLGHEYAHISSGDLDAHPLAGHEPEKTLQAKEFEADKIGFMTVVKAAHSEGAGIFAPFLFLAGLDLLACAAAAYNGQPAPSTTSSPGEYPTSLERTTNLLSWLETSPFGTKFANQIRAAMDCYNLIQDVWKIIWTPFRAAREQLTQFDPAIHGPSLYPEADVLGVVTILRRLIQAHLEKL